MAQPPAQQQVKCGEWINERVLGAGGFGQVTLWRNEQTGQKIAIKTCKQQLQQRHLERWNNEVETMRRMDHPNIVRFHEVPAAVQDNFVVNYRALGMEFCEEGDLRKMLTQPENCCGLRESRLRDLLRDIGSAINFLHSKDIVHRDLKPENIVMQRQENKLLFKIIDLGYAKDLSEHSCGTSFVGTLHYLAPEFFGTMPLRYSETVDCWSFGLVAFECITGRRPFFPQNLPAQVLCDLKQNKTDQHICTVDSSSSHHRYSSAIPQPHWLNDVFTQRLVPWLQEMLRLDPQRRGGAQKNQWFVNLQAILQEGRIQVCNTLNSSVVTIPLANGMTVTKLKQCISDSTGVDVSDQVLLFVDGDVPNPTMQVAQQQCNKPSRSRMLYLFKHGAKYEPQPHSVHSREEADGLLKDLKHINQLQLLRLLRLSFNHMCRLMEQCLKLLVSPTPLMKSIKRLMKNCRHLFQEHSSTYQRLSGAIQLFQQSLDMDIRSYEQNENSVVRHEALLNSWLEQKDMIEKWMRETFPRVEEHLRSIDVDLFEPIKQMCKVEEFVQHTRSDIDERKRRKETEYNNIRRKLRSLDDERVENRTEQLAVVREQIENYSKDAFEVVRNYADELLRNISNHIRSLLAIHERFTKILFQPQNIEVVQNLEDKIYRVKNFQTQRQQSLWEILLYIKGESTAFMQQVANIASYVQQDDPDPHASLMLRNQMCEHLDTFNQFAHEVRHDVAAFDLDWDFLDSNSAPPPAIERLSIDPTPEGAAEADNDDGNGSSAGFAASSSPPAAANVS